MRKITSLLTLILCFFAGTAQAQITSLDDLDNTKAYSVETLDGYNYRTSTATYDRSSWYAAAGATSMTSVRQAGATFDPTNTAQQFVFVKDGENTYLYSVAAKKFLSKNNVFSSYKGDPVTIQASSAQTGTFIFVFDSSHWINSNGSGIISIDSWTYADAGNSVYITEQATSVDIAAIKAQLGDVTLAKAEAKANLSSFTTQIPALFPAAWVTSAEAAIDAATTVAEVENLVLPAKYARLKNKSFTDYYLGVASTGAIRTTDQGEAVLKFQPTTSGTFYVQGYASKYYLGTVATSSDVPSTATASVPYVGQMVGDYVAIRPVSGGSYQYVHFGGGGVRVVGWSTDADATQFTLTEVTDLPQMVTFNVVDASNNIIYSEEAAYNTGASIAALPSSLERSYVTTTSVTTLPYTVTDAAGQTITVSYTLNTDFPFVVSADAASAKWYYMHFRGQSGASAKYVSNTGGSSYATGTTKVETSEGQWAFLGDPFNGFKVINRAGADGQALGYSSIADGAAITLMTPGNVFFVRPISGFTGFGLSTTATGNVYVHDYSSKLSMWNSTWAAADQGSAITIEEVPAELNLYSAVETELLPFFTNGVDKYFGLTSASVSSISTKWEQNITDQKFTESEYNEMKADVKAAIVMPADGYYRLKNKMMGTGDYGYMAVNSESALVGNLTATQALSDAGAVFYVKKTGDYYSFKAQNVYGGVASQSVPVTADANVHNFILDVAEPGYGYIQTSGGVARSCYHASASQSYNIVGWEVGADATRWEFEDAGGIVLPMTECNGKYYATTYLPFAVRFDATTAIPYTVFINAGKDKAIYTSIDSYEVPAETGVLLICDGATNGALAEIIDSAEPVTGNELVGHFFASGVSNALVLNIVNGNIGFYSLSANGTLAANRAYIDNSTNAIRSLQLVAGDATGIQSVTTKAGENKVFDLQGRRVQNAQKGLYIVNGKKVIL